MRKDKKRDPELVALAVRMYHELKSTQKVARRLEIAPSVMYRLLIGAGVVMPERHSPEIQERKKALKGDMAVQAAKDYADGMKLSDMRRKYGVGTFAIRTAVKDAGIEWRPRGGRSRMFSQQQKQRISELYSQGWTQSQIGKEFNASQAMIGRVLIKIGAETRDQGNRGCKHGSWNGGRVTIGQYVAIMVDRDDPLFVMAHNTGYVLEHRLVMARHLGRPLSDDETVHHIDGNHKNNDISNLQLRKGRHGKGTVFECRKCGCRDIVAVEL